MLNIDEINAEIERLEGGDHTTYGVCEKLATLYIVKENLEKKNMNNISSPVRTMPPAMGIGAP